MTERAKCQKSINGGAAFAAIDPGPAIVSGRQNEVCTYSGNRMSRQDEDRVWWFGYYTVYDIPPTAVTHYLHVRITNNGGGAWADANPAGTGNPDIFTTLRVNPDNWNRIVVYDRTDDDLFRSLNAGAAYITLDAAMDFDLSDLVMDWDDEEDHFYISNLIAAALLLEETVDEGANWVDITSDFWPKDEATTCIVQPRRVT